jgi:DNA invertase Pin-like site-specific DNA recombinase
MTKTVAIYARVSTDAQSTLNQERELRAVADRAGWRVVEVYIDHGISGAKSRKDRPAFDRLLKDAARRRFDLIACWSVDRLGRSLQDLIHFLQEIHSLGIGLFLHQQSIDSGTPAGKAMFGMLSIFAEFERSIIQQRVLAGLARARAQGKTLGRPPLALEKTRAIQALLQDGLSLRKVAKLTGSSLSSVQRIATRDVAGSRSNIASAVPNAESFPALVSLRRAA